MDTAAVKCSSLSSNHAERGPQVKGINVCLTGKSANSVFIHFSTKAADFEKIDRKPRSKKIFLSSKEFLMESHFQKKKFLFSLICSKKGFEPHRADLERRELRSQRLSSSSSPALIEAWKG